MCYVEPANYGNSGQNKQGLDPKPYRRKPRFKLANPLQVGFADFLERHASRSNNSSTYSGVDHLISKLPKRYTLYSSLLLLPANVFTATPEWSEFYAALSLDEKQELYDRIIVAFRGQGPSVTHVAINAPIAAKLGTGGGESSGEMTNVMRSPAGLVPLHGDWGPRDVLVRFEGGESTETYQPTKEDFERAFWVSAVQNGGVTQVWSPLWTMFSRGNVKEKARILGEGNGVFEGLDVNGGLGQDLGDISVADLFVGIGYFAFSYLRRGVGLVWGWEINAWSVEGLKRGCKRNGWRVEILTVRGDGQVVDEQGREGDDALKGVSESFDMARHALEGKAAIRCLIFHGDNKWSGRVMAMLKEICMGGRGSNEWKRVRHVNLGLLPNARDSWPDSVRILDSETGGWLHVHENVDVREFQLRKAEIVHEIGNLVAADAAKQGEWETSCCHLEQVKTYAPGVMHCVFDIQVLPAR